MCLNNHFKLLLLSIFYIFYVVKLLFILIFAP